MRLSQSMRVTVMIVAIFSVGSAGAAVCEDQNLVPKKKVIEGKVVIGAIDAGIYDTYYDLFGGIDGYEKGAAYLTTKLKEGHSVASLRKSLIKNDPAVRKEVNILYKQYLGREIADQDFRNVQDYLAGGGNLRSLEKQIVENPDCTSRPSDSRDVASSDQPEKALCEDKKIIQGGDIVPSGYEPEVLKMYTSVLGGSAGPQYMEGKRYLSDLYREGYTLDSLRRDLVKEKAVEDKLNSLYQAYLGRNIHSSDLKNAREFLAKGGSMRDLEKQIVHSPECAEKLGNSDAGSQESDESSSSKGQKGIQ